MERASNDRDELNELGVVVESEQGERFLPSSVVLRVVPMPELTVVPGAPRQVLGAALYEGDVVLVLAAGPGTSDCLICRIDDSLIGLGGVRVVRSGVPQQSLPLFDLRGLVESAANSRKMA